MRLFLFFIFSIALFYLSLSVIVAFSNSSLKIHTQKQIMHQSSEDNKKKSLNQNINDNFDTTYRGHNNDNLFKKKKIQTH